MGGEEGEPKPIYSEQPKEEPFDFQAWEEDRFPPVVNPVDDVLQLTKEDEEKARHFLTSFWTTRINKKTQASLWRVSGSEMHRLDYMFPEIHDEIIGQFTHLDVEDWRKSREITARGWSEEERDSFKRGYYGVHKGQHRNWPWKK